MLNARNIKSKRRTKEVHHTIVGACKVREKKGNRALKLDCPARWKINPVFDVPLLEPYKVSDRPNREQPPRAQEDVEGDLECEVERIAKSEVIISTRKVRSINKQFKEL